VPDYVRPHLASLGIAGFRIPHWDAGPGDHVVAGHDLPELSFVTYATHDHPAVAAMWEAFRATAADPAAGPEAVHGARRNLRLLSEFAGLPLPANESAWTMYSDAVKWALLEALLASRSRRAALMITDLHGMHDRFNMPGTTGGENWRLRLPWTVGELRADPLLSREAARLAEVIRATGRTP
jgi:4-alpha-glucanotransferase